jgi:hypothetical protein
MGRIGKLGVAVGLAVGLAVGIAWRLPFVNLAGVFAHPRIVLYGTYFITGCT